MKNRLFTRIVVIVALCLYGFVAPGCSGPRTVDEANKAEAGEVLEDTQGFIKLFTDMVQAYEAPETGAADALEPDLEVVHTNNDPATYQVARSVVEHWRRVYLDPNYLFYMWNGQDLAPELQQQGLMDSPTHAFVVLGYELKDGEMTEELKGRCNAAAAAARTFPSTMLVCSGGPTGKNNPEKHTEAGLMKDYLVNTCGIDASRILTDERAMTTAENAQNTMEMLRQSGMQTMTIVTSSYHQRWGQAVYNAVAAKYAQEQGYTVKIQGNYSFQIEPENPAYRQDDRIAVRQIAQVMGLPQGIAEALPSIG